MKTTSGKWFYSIALFFAIVPSLAHGLTVIVNDPYEQGRDIVVEREASWGAYDSVGDLTIQILNDAGVSYQGSRQGIQSIFNTPIGLDALDVISNSEMKAYGWCFSVDGEISDVYPHQVNIDASIQEIKWFFGFAWMKNGVWDEMCLPAYSNSSP